MGKSRRMHGAFVVSEVALAVVLLVAAGMLGRTLLRLYSLDPGVKTSHVVTARMGLSPAALESPAKIRAAWLDVLESGRRVPGVESIAMVDTVPMREGSNPIGYWTNADLPPEDKQPLVLANSVTPNYLKVMGVPLLKGRFLEDRDRVSSESVVVIDEVMAEQAFGGQDPLGKHLWIGIAPDPARVVGVVRHVRYWGPAADDRAQVRAQLYYPFAQVPDGLLRRWSELMSIAVRASVPPLQLVAPLRQALRGAGNDQVLYQVRTMDQLAAEKVSRQRFLLLLFGFFAGLALLLACVGIYGVLAYLTSRRVAEIGVRMALGASARDVQWLVLRDSLAMTLLGAGLGSVAALAAARALEHNVEGMQPTSFSSLAVMLPALIAAALCASYLPARRASRTDPVAALRQE